MPINDYIKSKDYTWKDNTKDIAIIIETRPTPNLEWVIRNINHHTDFKIRHYGTPTNLPIENVQVSINSFEDYNKLLTSKEFWKDLPENVFIFQSDSFMLKNWNPLFEQYDYIGSPWKWAYDYKGCYPYQVGGNGGISFRKSSIMRRIIDKFPPEEFRNIHKNPNGNEDMYFTLHLKDVGANIPTIDIQKQFGVETLFYENPMCVHAIDKWLSDEEIKIILK